MTNKARIQDHFALYRIIQSQFVYLKHLDKCTLECCKPELEEKEKERLGNICSPPILIYVTCTKTAVSAISRLAESLFHFIQLLVYGQLPTAKACGLVLPNLVLQAHAALGGFTEDHRLVDIGSQTLPGYSFLIRGSSPVCNMELVCAMHFPTSLLLSRRCSHQVFPAEA
jgi:hypothetical protein